MLKCMIYERVSWPWTTDDALKFKCENYRFSLSSPPTDSVTEWRTAQLSLEVPIFPATYVRFAPFFYVFAIEFARCSFFRLSSCSPPISLCHRQPSIHSYDGWRWLARLWFLMRSNTQMMNSINCWIALAIDGGELELDKRHIIKISRAERKTKKCTWLAWKTRWRDRNDWKVLWKPCWCYWCQEIASHCVVTMNMISNEIDLHYTDNRLCATTPIWATRQVDYEWSCHNLTAARGCKKIFRPTYVGIF